MDILIIVLLCVLATLKVTIQSFFGKHDIKTTPDAILFNVLVFVFSMVIFSPYIFNQTLPCIIFGAIFGLFTVTFQLSYVKALSIGPVSITVMMANLSMIFPVAVSAIVYKEPISVLRGAGILLTIVAFVVCTDFKTGSKINSKWLKFVTIVLISDGLCQISQKMLTTGYEMKSPQSFVAISYFFAIVFSMIFYFVFKMRGEKRTVVVKSRVLLGALMIGVVLGVFQALYAYAASTIEGTLLYPSFGGGSIVASALAGFVLFKDRLVLKQKISILISVVAIVLMIL